MLLNDEHDNEAEVLRGGKKSKKGIALAKGSICDAKVLVGQ